MTEITVYDPTLSPTVSTKFNGFIRPSGNIAKWSAKRGARTSPVTLELIRDNIRQLNLSVQPKDMVINLSQVFYDFTDGRAKMIPFSINRQGQRVTGEPMFFTTHGWSQWGKQLGLPRSGANFIKECATRMGGERGLQIATMNALSWGARVDKSVTVRTHRYNGELYIRSIVSGQYGIYDNLDFIEDVLAELGNQSVYRGQITDSGMMLRLVDSVETGEIQTNTLYQTLNLWNSEVGFKRAGMGAGTMRLSCLNGMGEYTSSGIHQWSHRGSSQRISDGVAGVAQAIRTKSSGLVDEYNRALDMQIANTFDDMMSWVGTTAVDSSPMFNKSRMGDLETAMFDETGNDPLTLAGVVDGITLMAQDLDVFEQMEAERIAVKVMRQGIREFA